MQEKNKEARDTKKNFKVKVWVLLVIGIVVLGVIGFVIWERVEEANCKNTNTNNNRKNSSAQFKRRDYTESLVLGAVLTALVIILQMLGAFIRFGPFSISLVLIPIVIGAAKCGAKISTWLGFVFGIVVLMSGDAAAFMAINPAGTIITVLAKGTLCGLVAGLVFKALFKFNPYVAVVASAIICPLVNTGIFLLGCVVFFMETITQWSQGEGFNNVVSYMFLGLVGANFLVEFGTNIVLSPTIVFLLNAGKKKLIDKK
jgi:uncharacterized membrane protein